MGRSLRARLILGAVFWTVGLFGILVVLHNEIMRRNPWLPPRLTASTLSHTPHLTAIAIVCLLIGAWQIDAAFPAYSGCVAPSRRCAGEINGGSRARILPRCSRSWTI
jgi:hypothetical protein